MKDLNVWLTYHDDAQIKSYGLKENKIIHLFKGNNLNVSGESINYLNSFYSELTTIYWVWKNNIYSEYVGFCHYRRKFDRIIKLRIKECQVLAITYLPVTLLQHYKANHNYQDYCDIIDILIAKYGENNSYSRYMMCSNVFVPFCCFIMHYTNFEKLCSFVFPILFEFDKKHGLNMQADNYLKKTKMDFPYGIDLSYQQRAISFLAERLVSCYIVTNMTPLCVNSVKK